MLVSELSALLFAVLATIVRSSTSLLSSAVPIHRLSTSWSSFAILIPKLFALPFLSAMLVFRLSIFWALFAMLMFSLFAPLSPIIMFIPYLPLFPTWSSP